MKEHLVELSSPDTGRVPMDAFYRQSMKVNYNFTESTAYLKSIGALDTTGRLPQVRLSNYVLGPTNCIARSTYFSVCCINECEAVMTEIEVRVQSPIASPEHL